jgi:DNA-binding CsgD family transcriptional regulator
VSRNTVKSHVAAIYRKLGATSRSGAVEHARRTGLLDHHWG